MAYSKEEIQGKHLRYDLQSAHAEHPQAAMKGLGITYQHGLPSSMGGFWIFWNCENIPNELPNHLEKENSDPNAWIGYGLTEEMAKAIKEK